MINHCAECGYDLTGLTLPHRCPECGVLTDPAAQREAAVVWYTSWRGLMFCRPPAEVARYLDDSRCRRVARRRLIWGVIVTCLFSTVLLVAANGIVFVTDVQVWWEPTSQPTTRQYRGHYDRVDRLLALNFHFDKMFWPKPPPGTKEVDVPSSRRMELRWLDPDPLMVELAILPICAALPCVVLLIILRAVAARRRTPSAVLPGLVAPYAFHFAAGTTCAAVTLPLYCLADVLDSSSTVGWTMFCIAFSSLIVLALGPPRLFLYAWWAMRPRLRRPSLIACTITFVVTAALFPAIWFGVGWLVVLLWP